MAFNGAGVFERLYNWVSDKAAGTKIRADRMDAEMDGFATGLSNCITVDGQSTVTDDIPMNSNKLTGLAAGSSNGDSLRYEQLFGGASKDAEVTVASDTTCNILGAASERIAISGSATITSFGTGTNKIRFVRLTGDVSITYNATSLITPNGLSISGKSGDTFVVVSDGSSNARILAYWRATKKQSIWVPSGSMIPRSTNGPGYGLLEMTTNKNMVQTLDFDASTAEYAQFDVRMPSSWDEGTVTFIPVWSHPSTTTNFGVTWKLAGVAISNDDTLDVAFGTAQSSVDTGGTTSDLYQGPESSAITIAGTPASGDYVQFRIQRDPTDGSDNMAVDARLHGVYLFFNTTEDYDA